MCSVAHIWRRLQQVSSRILTWYGHSDGNWDSLWALHIPPGSCKVPCPYTFICVHLQGVMVPAEKPVFNSLTSRYFSSKILVVFQVSISLPYSLHHKWNNTRCRHKLRYTLLTDTEKIRSWTCSLVDTCQQFTILLSWRWRQQVPPQQICLSTWLYSF